ncbi:MAG: methylenetetrahydrofolate reductase [Fidelibacterota bacterium]
MKVTKIIKEADKPLFSYEIMPPLRGGSAEKIFQLVEDLMPYNPPFIDLTSRSAEIEYFDTPNGKFERHVRRKRPGTIGLSAAIKNRFNVETVPHLLCNGFTREETEDALIELNYLNILNVLAVRGDDLRRNVDTRHKTINVYANDLVNQIVELNAGHYLDELLDASATDFCIGVGGYPEKHFEAISFDTDLKYLKQKVDAGADYIVTQMFFDNKNFFKFVERARAAGIKIPIIPGLKILTLKRHLEHIPKNFYVKIPDSLAQQVEDAKTDSEVKNIGLKWAIDQTKELYNAEVPCIHFYIMQSATQVVNVVKEFV